MPLVREDARSLYLLFSDESIDPVLPLEEPEDRREDCALAGGLGDDVVG